MNSPTISDVERQARKLLADALDSHLLGDMIRRGDAISVSARIAIRALITALSSQKSEREKLERYEEALIRIALEDRHTRRIRPNPEGGLRGHGGMIAVFALTGINGSFVGDAEISAIRNLKIEVDHGG